MEKITRTLVYFAGPNGQTSYANFTFGGNANDAEPPSGSGILDVENYPLLLNRATGLFDRQSSLPDNTDAQAPGTLGLIGSVSRMYAFNGATWSRIYGGTPSDGGGAAPSMLAWSLSSGFNGSSWDRLRTPTTFKGVTTAAAGATAVWTPAAGKKFRVMKYMIQFSPDATLAVAGAITATLQDGATNLPFFLRSYYTAVIAANAPIDSSGWIDLGNGYLSSAANNVLNINLSVALASGLCSVFVAGTEE